MAAKWELEMITVGEALVLAYSELETLGKEVANWSRRNGPYLKPDTTDRGYRLRQLDELFSSVVVPDFSQVPEQVLGKLVGANINVGEKGRAARRDNALARLRPSAALLEKEGFLLLAKSIRQHESSLDIWPFPRAFSRGYG